MKAHFLSAAAAVLIAGCSTMAGEGSMQGDRGAMAMTEAARTYMQMAHSSDMFEVESSRLALQMSRNEMVRSFAQMMINDHTRMMQEMMALGMDPNMASMPMMPRHAQMLQRLQAAPAMNFDMMYHQEQMMAHQEALNLHRTYAANGDNQALRSMAARAVPMVESHLNYLQTHGSHMAMQPVMTPPQPMYQPAPMPVRRSGERG